MSLHDDESGERSPLLLVCSETEAAKDILPQATAGNATFSENMINTAKSCMGTGSLTLPFAARQGGFILHFLGSLGLACWVTYSIERLLHCLELLPGSSSKRAQPPPGTSTLGKVSFQALGYIGLNTLDGMMATMLLGIIVAYFDAALSFLKGTPLTTGSYKIDALVAAIAIGTLSNVPNLGYLSKLSATGLAALFLTWIVIGCYGDFSGFTLNLWPQKGLLGASHWFGCSIFGFGTVPITYNLRDSMAHPEQMLVSTSTAISLVAGSYILVGIAMNLLYPDIKGDMLQELPPSGFLPVTIRLAMTLVAITTAPLLVVPCGELIEGKLFHGTATHAARISVRMGICIISMLISMLVPNFVDAISLVGCCCVAFVSFVIPPVLHVFLLLQQRLPMSGLTTTEGGSHKENERIRIVKQRTIWIDMAMLVCGVVAAGVSTTCIFQLSQESSRR